MEDTVLDAAGTTLVKNFIWVNATSNSFKPDELEKTIKKLSTLKQLYSGLNTFLEEKIAELEQEKIKHDAKPITAETITKDAIQDAIQKITSTKPGGRKRRTKRYKKRSSKRKHRKSKTSKRKKTKASWE